MLTPAQFTAVDPKILAHVLAALVIIFGLGLAVYGAWRQTVGKHTSIEPQPLLVKGSPDLVTAAQCAQNHQPLCQRLEQLEKSALDGVERRRRIHEDIEKASATARDLSSNLRLEIQGQIAQLHEKVNEVREHQAATERSGAITIERLTTIEGDIKTLLRRSA